MSTALRQRWADLAGRERALLAGGSVLAGVLLGWAWLWQPLAQEREALRAEAAANAAALAWMRPAAQQAAAAGGIRAVAAGGDDRSLLARVDAGVREAGLAGGLLAVEPLAADRVRVRFSAVAFDALVIWLEREAGAGLRVEELSLRRVSGPGLVDGQVVLSVAGR